MKDILKDPDSAKFGEVMVSDDGRLSCAMVNAKNSMGGYTGESALTLQKTDAGEWRVIDDTRSECNAQELEVTAAWERMYDDDGAAQNMAPASDAGTTANAAAQRAVAAAANAADVAAADSANAAAASSNLRP
ncbi:MAG: hypothetical protein DCE92_03580 [Alphaproteobacteria bacterium]|nr:MAG: hypothetical protein DCE92_03580 [Alphaproteobacteria bacterium]